MPLEENSINHIDIVPSIQSFQQSMRSQIVSQQLHLSPPKRRSRRESIMEELRIVEPEPESESISEEPISFDQV